MNQCEGKTKNGNSCFKRAQKDKKFCAQHDPLDSEGKPRVRCKGILVNGHSQCSHWATNGAYCSLHSEATDEENRNARPRKDGPEFVNVFCSGTTLKGTGCKMKAKVSNPQERYYCSKHQDQQGGDPPPRPPPPRPQPRPKPDDFFTSFKEAEELIRNYLRSSYKPPPPPPPPPPPVPKVNPVEAAKKYFGITSVNYDALKKDYRARALQLHPDKPGGDAEKFKELSNHFAVLEQYVKNGFH
jgi:hypothetical protein